MQQTIDLEYESNDEETLDSCQVCKDDYECGEQCTLCNSKLCEDCIHECFTCLTTCVNCLPHCEICMDPICIHTTDNCISCNVSMCEGCRYHCDICDEHYSCEECSRRCTKCFDLFCSMCVKDKEQQTCNNCKHNKITN